MKKQYLIIALLFLLPQSSQSAPESMGTHVGQEQLRNLQSQLKPLSYKQRKELLAYLRKYFTRSTLRPLEDSETKRIAHLIVTSYENLVKSDHKAAAASYAKEAQGVINMNPGLGHKKAKKTGSASRTTPRPKATGVEPLTEKQPSKSGGWLQEIGTALGGGAAGAAAETAASQPASNSKHANEWYGQRIKNCS